jgi:hypothetical protein
MPSKTLEKYLSNYKGTNDLHLRPLKLIKNKYKIERVLYAGSWIHLTPSLVFPYVIYVDSFAEMKSMFSDSELIEYIQTNSETVGKPIIRFYQKDYRKGIKEEKESFDLLISLSSGFVSQYCKSYLKKKGLFFVNNEHYDATMAYVDPSFLLIGVFTHTGRLIEKTERIQEYFLTKRNQTITIEMVRENSENPPSKSKYKLKKKAPFYLFQKM